VFAASRPIGSLTRGDRLKYSGKNPEPFCLLDFIVLDMEVDTKTPLILGRPFLSMANAHIDVGAGKIQLNINGQKERFAFRPKVEQCS
jgi:hypothetical protein